MLSVADFACESGGCRLRPLCVADAAMLAPIYTDARTQQFVGQLLAEADAIDRIEACIRANQQPQLEKFYLALENPQHQLAGMLAVFDIDNADSSLELGIMLLPGRQQTGLAKSAYSALIRRSFMLGFQRVYANMHPQNLAAQRLARQCGMTQCISTPAEVRYQICRFPR